MNSFTSLLRALLTLIAAAFPTATMLGVFASHPDDTVKIIEIVGNGISALWLYLKQPHSAIRDKWDGLVFFVQSFFRRGSAS